MPDGNAEEKFTPKSADELRQEVTEEYNFDADSDTERIEKLTQERLDHQEKLSTAIRQKKAQREKREAHEKRLKELGYDPETGNKLGEQPTKKEEESPLKEKLEKTEKELDEIRMENAGDFSEALQKEIRTFAQLNKCSYKEATKSEYIKFQVMQEEQRTRNEEAALGGDKGNRVAGKKIGEVKSGDLKNLSDEDYAKWKKENKIG
jgi:hypothetical protein